MNQPTFVLGLGAQKAGTTWIHNYLSSPTFSNFGFRKEYHVFDALHVRECRIHYKRAEKEVLKYINSNQSRPNERNAHLIERLAFLHNTQNYYEYFHRLLNITDVHLTGDITPSYAALDKRVLCEIKNQFNARGIRVVPVFIMRDPVKRLQSLARMSLKNRNIDANAKQEIQLIKQFHLGKIDRTRANYSKTLDGIEEVFGNEGFIGFYETLFSKREIQRLCNTIGIDYVEPNFQKRTLASRSKNILPQNVVNELHLGYKSIYDDCRERFSDEFIDQIWTSTV